MTPSVYQGKEELKNEEWRKQ